jgi:hypothetical protein
VYMKAMEKWVGLLQDGQDGKAQKYFDGLPAWMKDLYLTNNPDKKFQQENDRMFSLAAEYFNADRATQREILGRNPGLRRWLAENDTGAARANAIRYAYMTLEDPWLKRVYREKYPEVFSVEAKGAQKRRDVAATLEKYPELVSEWLRWYEDLGLSLSEANKYMRARPRMMEQDYSAMRGQETLRGRSAADVAGQATGSSTRIPNIMLRNPRVS